MKKALTDYNKQYTDRYHKCGKIRYKSTDKSVQSINMREGLTKNW